MMQGLVELSLHYWSVFLAARIGITHYNVFLCHRLNISHAWMSWDFLHYKTFACMQNWDFLHYKTFVCMQNHHNCYYCTLQKSHIKTQDLPPVPDARNPLTTLTNDGYSTLEDPNNPDITNNQGESSSDGYTLLVKEGDEPAADTGYDEVNEQDADDTPHYEMSGDPTVAQGSGIQRKMEDNDDHDYEEPYWEPASKEEELMDQLAKLSVPVIPAKNIE